MKMTILRALNRLEMDCDLDVTTEVPNLEWKRNKEGKDTQVTIYGTENEQGELYYIVLDKEVVQAIQDLPKPQ